MNHLKNITKQFPEMLKLVWNSFVLTESSEEMREENKKSCCPNIFFYFPFPLIRFIFLTIFHGASNNYSDSPLCGTSVISK